MLNISIMRQHFQNMTTYETNKTKKMEEHLSCFTTFTLYSIKFSSRNLTLKCQYSKDYILDPQLHQKKKLWAAKAECSETLQLAAVGDHHFPLARAVGRAEALDLAHDVHALHHGAEDHVLVVQPGGFDGADEELRPVGVGAGVGHGQDAGAGVLQSEVLVLEFVAVDGLAARAVAGGEVAALAHEVGDHAVEARALVAEALLARAQRPEVLGRLGDHVGAELKGGEGERELGALRGKSSGKKKS